MPKKLKLTIATAKDIESILALDLLCFNGIWSADGYLREIDSPNSTILLLWLAEANSSPKLIGLGCLWSIVEEAHITLLGIHPQYQRQGLGILLLHSLLQDAVQRKLERATLEVKATNQPAITLYERFGFKLAGKRKKYYPKTGEDALILWLNGLDKPEFQQTLKSWQQRINQRLSSKFIVENKNKKIFTQKNR